jgi:hypothetical protein
VCPPNEIAFIHDAKTEQQEQQLYRNVREGKIRVLLGSTEKMGAGVNVQDRLVALHHINPTWRPADIEQREGRIVRQGNLNDEVSIYTYVTENSFDAQMWDLLRIKATFIEQMMSGNLDVRNVEDVGDQVMGYAEVASAALGSTVMKDKMAIDKEVKNLTGLRTQFGRTQMNAETEIADITRTIPLVKAQITRYEADQKTVHDTKGDLFSVTIHGQDFTDRTEAGEKLFEIIKELSTRDFKDRVKQVEVGKFGNFTIKVDYGHVVLYGQSGQDYPITITQTALGTVQKMESILRSFDDLIAGAHDSIQTMEGQKEDYTKILAKKFEQADKLQDALRRQVEINREISQMNAANSNAAAVDDAATNNESQPQKKAQTFIPAKAVNNANKASSKQFMSQTSKGPVTKAQIMTFIMKEFKVPIGTRRFKGRARAIYKPFVNEIRLKSFGDFVAIAHELGHNLDKKYEFSQKPTSAIKSGARTACKHARDSKQLHAGGNKSRGICGIYKAVPVRSE